MPAFFCFRRSISRTRQGILLLTWCALTGGGCTSPAPEGRDAFQGQAGVNRREEVRSSATGTAGPNTPTVNALDEPAPPYRLNTENIIRLVYELSPLVTVSREQMNAAEHGLREFKTNLSRFEPFIEVKADASKFPERSDAKGTTGEVVGGIQKETFEGAIIRFEGGASGSRVEFGDVEQDQEEIEEGSGGLFRARVEIPFAGSRKRQNRVISQAFQETSARKAVLNYLDDYRSYVASALTYHQLALLNRDYAQTYLHQLDKIETLLQDPRVKPEDRLHLQSVAGDTRVVIQQYQTSHHRYLMLLLQYLGLAPDGVHILDDESDAPQTYIEQSRSAKGVQQLLDEAFENNPTFGVLRRAIEDAELQRELAITGDFDITAFVEGTQFAFGSETFDDRVGGWEVGAGVTVRLNDHRVLTATRRKAEAEIRQFQAQIEAEQLSTQRQIATQSDKLVSYHESRPGVIENLTQLTEEFETRSRTYLERGNPPLTIDDVLLSLSGLTRAQVRLAANRYYIARAENALRIATGQVYRLVGLEVNGQDNADVE